MYRYKKLLTCLGLDSRDQNLLEYTGLVSRMAQSEYLHVVHVQSPSLVMSSGEGAEDDMYDEDAYASPEGPDDRLGYADRMVAAHFTGPETVEVATEILEGAPLDQLLRTARNDEVDLVIVGGDRPDASLGEKLARKAPSSVLVIPPNAPPQIRRVLVPVDFSNHAADAVDVAVAFAEAAGLQEVHLLHVYSVPTTYLKLGKTYAEFHEILKGHLQDRYEAFLKDIDLRGLKPVQHFVKGLDVPGTIREQVAKLDIDLVMVGTRGRSDAAAVLMGNVAERVIRAVDVPTVAVKRKGATLGFLDALLQL